MPENLLPIRVVCGTRVSKNNFLTQTMLGKSIKNFIDVSKAQVRLFPENSLGLSEIYNKAIDESINDPAILVFAHDDILICDYFWEERIRDGINKFHISGLAGNIRRIPNQPSWAFIDDKFNWDSPFNLSGTVAHGITFPQRKVLSFGATNQKCKILDGVLFAVKSDTLIKHELRFDINFKFHFYDLDFCRQAEIKNLIMGTIPLAIVHASAGDYSRDEWKNSYINYLKKWKN
jgi:hypothetical protein